MVHQGLGHSIPCSLIVMSSQDTSRVTHEPISTGFREAIQGNTRQYKAIRSEREMDAALTCASESGVEEQQVTPCEQPKCRLNNAYHKPLENALHNKFNVPPTVDRSPNMK